MSLSLAVFVVDEVIYVISDFFKFYFSHVDMHMCMSRGFFFLLNSSDQLICSVSPQDSAESGGGGEGAIGNNVCGAFDLITITKNVNLT